ncbi:germination protein YpeB [Desulfuribacillus alkaliarsenatis]|uniref:Germination protein YpeB n=1 Tax=Desulfuribacillus alkaliarsenatis TaxID=766136 RepID=A0A1E5FZS4_9FIRM|nr:germination protein YpeB [Desulfuribacillus alkaliarsenatis]OEF96030.1 germination protein YpeB [Desulfuribacillus alkaliarsenatis]
MYKKVASWLTPILAIAIIAVGYWGYTEQQEKQQLYNKAENQYQRAFHELSYYVNSVQDELGTAIAINSPGQYRQCLSNVWRLSYAAQARIGQLPLGIMEFSETENFIARVADFSYRTAVRDLDEEPLTDEEWETLHVLYDCATRIQGEISSVQTAVLAERLSWTEFEMMYAATDEPLDNNIINGFNNLEQEVGQFPEVSWGVGIDSINQIKQDKIKRMNDGERFDEQQIENKIVEFLELGPEKQFDIVRNPDAGDYVTYSVVVTNSDEDIIYLDVTEIEGHVLWLLQDRPVGRPTIDLSEAEQNAAEYLRKLDVENAIATNIDEYENIAVIDFASYIDDIVVYPDKITVKIALDNGEIIGFSAMEYYLNNNEREIAEPNLTIDEARDRLNSRLQIEEQRLAIIEDNTGVEVLTYEFIGTLNNSTYRVFVNVENGREEKVEKIDHLGIERVFRRF